MTLKASIQPTIYSDLLAGMQKNEAPWVAPSGHFYELLNDIVPFSPQPTVLKIESDLVGNGIEVEVVQINSPTAGVDPRKNQRVYTIVPTSTVATVGVQLGRGLNKIIVRSLSSDESALVYVRATTIVALWEAFARVLYIDAVRIINEQQQAVSSKLATRLIEPFISFQDLLPEVQSLQILATRLAARGLVHTVGTNTGATELAKALTLSTPVYKKMDKDTSDLFPSLDPWVNNASQYSGREAHIWIPNLGVANWLAFLGYIASQPDLFSILSISEREVVVEYQGEVQHHLFDFDAFGTDFLTTLAQSECFKSIIVSMTIDVNLTFTICAAAYTFDLFITEDHPLGQCRFYLDSNFPLDSNCLFDSDELDPFSDGWVGLSLTGRFEQDVPFHHPLDTFIVPSPLYTGNTCGYDGFYTQVVANQKYEFDCDVSVTVSGFIQEALAWTLQSPDLTKWDIEINHLTGSLIATSGSLRVPDKYKVLRPDLTEVSFAITNLGQIQTVVPPPGGEILTSTLYIKATDATVWNITVDNSNTLQAAKIFPA